MKYYSELTKKLYDTEAEVIAAEKGNAAEKKLNEIKAKKAQIDAEIDRLIDMTKEFVELGGDADVLDELFFDGAGLGFLFKGV